MIVSFQNSKAKIDKYSYRGARVVESKENDRPCAVYLPHSGHVQMLSAVCDATGKHGQYKLGEVFSTYLTLDEVRAAVAELRDKGIEI